MPKMLRGQNVYTTRAVCAHCDYIVIKTEKEAMKALELHMKYQHSLIPIRKRANSQYNFNSDNKTKDGKDKAEFYKRQPSDHTCEERIH